MIVALPMSLCDGGEVGALAEVLQRAGHRGEVRLDPLEERLRAAREHDALRARAAAVP